MDEKLNNIKKMYDKQTYFDQYGGSFMLFIIITLTISLFMFYFHTMINVQPVIDDWSNQRCNPAYIPFAGFITKPDGMTATEYTAENFTYCTQNILSSITGFAVQPLTAITNSLQSVANNMKTEIQSVRGMFDKIRSSMQSVTEEIMGRLMNIMIPLMQIIISFKDVVGKIQGTMTAGLFTLLGSYYALKSLMGAIAQFIISILITLAAMIAAFWVVPFTWGAAMANTVIFVAIAIPMAVILAFMVDVLKVNTNLKIPKVKCFDKNTYIKMNDGISKKISEIEPGDFLSNNNFVTSKIKVERKGSTMYFLNNVLVSDSHIVNYNNKWIRVSDHPNAHLCEHYDGEFLYCLNTSQKVIEINGMIFTDWDEIYDNAVETLLRNANIGRLDDIHRVLNYGFAKCTQIKLQSGKLNTIDKIRIGDVLENGEKVYGIVELDGKTMEGQCIHHLGETQITGQLFGAYCRKTKIANHSRLYNLLTDVDTFQIGDFVFKDYNANVDRFLENS